jgi:hypothetical protein
MFDARLGDLVGMGHERLGLAVPPGASMAGFVYEDGDDTHICAWPHVEPAAIHRAVERARDLARDPMAQRVAFAVLWLALAVLIPSPFWNFPSRADGLVAHHVHTSEPCTESGAPSETDYPIRVPASIAT